MDQASGQVKCKDNRSLQVLAARAPPYPPISFKGHSSENWRMVQAGQKWGHPSPLRCLPPRLQHLLPAHLGPM